MFSITVVKGHLSKVSCERLVVQGQLSRVSCPGSVFQGQMSRISISRVIYSEAVIKVQLSRVSYPGSIMQGQLSSGMFSLSHVVPFILLVVHSSISATLVYTLGIPVALVEQYSSMT